jgi:hypothetical protein
MITDNIESKLIMGDQLSFGMFWKLGLVVVATMTTITGWLFMKCWIYREAYTFDKLVELTFGLAQVIESSRCG